MFVVLFWEKMNIFIYLKNTIMNQTQSLKIKFYVKDFELEIRLDRTSGWSA